VASAILDVVEEVEILGFHHKIDNGCDRDLVGQENDVRIILERHVL
jgi:hypothetical protein